MYIMNTAGGFELEAGQYFRHAADYFGEYFGHRLDCATTGAACGRTSAARGPDGSAQHATAARVTADLAAHANADSADSAATAVSEHFPAFEPAALQRDAKRRRCAGAANHRVAHCRQRTGTAFATNRVVDSAAPQPDCPSPATVWLPN